MNNNPIAPELVAQLVEPSLATTLSAGSNHSVQWRCPQDSRHTWFATPNTRKRSPGCPVCLNREVLPQVNSLTVTHPELAAQLLNPEQGQFLHAGTHTRAFWQCPTDARHRWDTEVVQRVNSGSGCPICSGRKPLVGVTDLATTHPEVAARLVDTTQAQTVGAGSAKKLTWQCQTNTEHTWSAAVRDVCGTGRSKPTGCPHCTNRGKRSQRRNATLGQLEHPVLGEAVDPVAVAKLSTGSGVAVQWKCSEHPDHPYTMSPRHRLRGQGCPICAGVTIVAGINDLATTHPAIAARLVDQSEAATVSRGSTKMLDWICPDGHTWTAAAYSQVAGNGCPGCSPIGSSYGEEQVAAVLEVLRPGIKRRVELDRKGRSFTEIDVVAGDLAVEFNGVFWHSETAGRSVRYHADKTAVIRSHGYDPMTIWADDWTNERTRAILVRSMAHRLSALDTLKEAMVTAEVGHLYDAALVRRHGARSLAVEQITGKQADTFFETNHLQSRVALTLSLALVDDQDEPVAVLGLRSASHSARAARAPGTWEIQRYATRGVVAGGFSRLLHAAEKLLQAQGQPLIQWITLSADDSSTGALYAACGFTVDGQVAPNYWYAGGKLRGVRHAKEAFQLKRFITDPDLAYQEGWTEREAAAANGLYRVYDAGKTRWIKQV